MLSQLYNNIGNAYANKGDLKQSITFLFKSLKLKEELDNKKGAANCCNNLAVIYKMQGNFNQSLGYNKQALRYRLQLADSQGIASSYANIALTYRNLKLNDTAEVYFTKALGIFIRLGYTKGIASAQNGLGILYKTKKQYDKAILAYSLALKISEQQNDKIGIAVTMSNLASVYGKKKNNAVAQKYFEQAVIAGKETKSFEVLMNMYDLYSVFYEENNDFKNALKYHLLYTDARDSLRSKDNNDALAEVKTRYETDIKEKENDNLKNQNVVKDLTIERKDTQRNVFIFLLITVIIIGILLYNRFKLKQKQLLVKEQLRQQDLRSKAVIEAEEKERVRIARELHDGIGQQLSAAKLNISGLQASVKTTNPQEVTMLQNAMDLLDESVKEVRDVSHRMMPNALLKSGLISAVREFINKITSSGDLKINLEIVGLNERLDNTVENIIFRVLQEIVNNIIKHANASEVSIQFIKHKNELTILIEDNGVGFDVQTQLTKTQGGIGLKNIQSRISFLNGEVFFDSFIGKGTTVTIEIVL
jgi:signal transduction histidine kinase